jgi:hypothetical protein
MKYTCVICGYRTLDSRCDWDICPICFWEDDVLLKKGDTKSPANGELRVSEAQANYMVYRCCSKEHLRFVRQPLSTEEVDPEWQPLPEAIELAKRMRLRSADLE